MHFDPSVVPYVAIILGMIFGGILKGWDISHKLKKAARDGTRFVDGQCHYKITSLPL
jgi:hypothetical protein